MSQKRAYDAVIFDLDGTLLDTLADLADSTNAIMERYHLPLRTVDEVRRFVGNGIRRLLEQAVPGGSSHPEFEQILADFLRYYQEHCLDKTQPYPGILSLLEDLSDAGYGLAIVSNKADAAVKKLNRIYFEERIPIAIGERQGISRKPAPDSVLEALRILGIPRERAVYVGDSDVDLRTAENAQMDVISVSWGFRDREFLLEHGAVPEQIAADVQEIRSRLIDEKSI